MGVPTTPTVGEAVRVIVADGWNRFTLSVTLVVIGADYCEENELLRLESLSIDFLD